VGKKNVETHELPSGKIHKNTASILQSLNIKILNGLWWEIHQEKRTWGY